jgi:hypothetical protein
MNDADKKLAEKLIIYQINSNTSSNRIIHDSRASYSQQKIVNPLDRFLIECGLSKTSSTTSPCYRRRSAEEELYYYNNNIQGDESFQEFWNRHKNELPGMIDLVKAYNMRPATSVASESLFSSANYVQRKHRSSLAPNTLKYSMLLRDQKILSDLINSYSETDEMSNS